MHIDQRHDAGAEEKGIALQIAKLEEAQDEARAPDSAAQAAHEKAVDDPLVEPAARRASRSWVPAISAE